MKNFFVGPRAQQGGLLTKFLLLIGVLLGLGVVLWVLLLPTLVVSTIRARTGFAVSVEKLSINPVTANMALTGLVLQNPDTWPMPDFAQVRKFRADVNLFSLLSDRYVADEVVIDVTQVTLVRNQQSVLNAVAFQDGLSGNGSGPAGRQKSSGSKKGFLIKHLVMKFDKLVYADYSGR